MKPKYPQQVFFFFFLLWWGGVAEAMTQVTSVNQMTLMINSDRSYFKRTDIWCKLCETCWILLKILYQHINNTVCFLNESRDQRQMMLKSWIKTFSVSFDFSEFLKKRWWNISKYTQCWAFFTMFIVMHQQKMKVLCYQQNS